MYRLTHSIHIGGKATREHGALNAEVEGCFPWTPKWSRKLYVVRELFELSLHVKLGASTPGGAEVSGGAEVRGQPSQVEIL